MLDIRPVVSRALAWLLLSVAVVLAYVGLVALLADLISAQLGRSAVATVIVACWSRRCCRARQRLVNRVMYGDRGDPTAVVSRIGAKPADRPRQGPGRSRRRPRRIAGPVRRRACARRATGLGRRHPDRIDRCGLAAARRGGRR